jgi:hypothetical protein
MRTGKENIISGAQVAENELKAQPRRRQKRWIFSIFLEPASKRYHKLLLTTGPRRAIIKRRR